MDQAHAVEDADATHRTILFDGVCNLCNGFVQFIIRHDRHATMRFGPLQSDAAKALLRNRSVPENTLGTVIYIRDREVLTRSTAALYILRDLGGPWTLFRAFLIIPAFLRDPVYRFIAHNRYRWFGQRQSCMLPTPELRGRFIDTAVA